MAATGKLSSIAVSTLLTGTIASVVSTAALALVAKAEGKRATRPTNATSHWLHGDAAASYPNADVAHTLTGYATHHASTFIWALPFEAWLALRPPRSTAEILGDAAATAAIAAIVDYGVTPRRLTPGWELVLSKRAIAITYVALAFGLAARPVMARAMTGRAQG